MTTDKLRECPFCHEAKDFWLHVQPPWAPGWFVVRCEKCGYSAYGETEDAAWAAWNRRAAPVEQGDRERERAEALCSEWYKTAALLPGDEPLDWLREHIAAEFASVRAEATEKERARAVEIYRTRADMEDYEVEAAIRGTNG